MKSFCPWQSSARPRLFRPAITLTPTLLLPAKPALWYARIQSSGWLQASIYRCAQAQDITVARSHRAELPLHVQSAKTKQFPVGTARLPHFLKVHNRHGLHVQSKPLADQMRCRVSRQWKRNLAVNRREQIQSPKLRPGATRNHSNQGDDITIPACMPATPFPSNAFGSAVRPELQSVLDVQMLQKRPGTNAIWVL